MYKFAGLLVNENVSEEIFIPLTALKGVDNNFVVFDDLFIGMKEGRPVAFDRICDHNGGQLILDADNISATCPIHKWTLRLIDGFYENGCPKKTLPIRLENENLVIVKSKELFPIINTKGLTNSDINFKFNAHASVSIEIDDFNIISDPWLIGSCFANGWWHAFPPSHEAIERLRLADYIYISHNHPDHLHIPTLEEYANKSTPILVPNFQSKSVENILRKLGFNNLVICDFMQQIKIETKNGGIIAVVIKSGDDRDDSTLLLCSEKRKVFLGVDANMPNRWILPKVDVLFTPFASGASGFPSRIDNFELAKKIEIINANRMSVLNNHVEKLIQATRPDIIIPYAGYFIEIGRDADVKSINIKNSPEDLISHVRDKFPGVRGVNPIDNPYFKLGCDGLCVEEVVESPSYFVDEEYISSVIEDCINGRDELSVKELLIVGERFLSSSFVDDLTVVIIPCDNSIANDYGFGLRVDFSTGGRAAEIISLNGESNLQLASMIDFKNNNLELLRVRSESLAIVLRDGLPLEDLSIGFQIKMFRLPNIYNFRFWDHFTNKEFIRV